MALIKCPECGNEVSDKAINCPNCGYPIKSIMRKKNAKITRINFLEALNWFMAVFGAFMLIGVLGTGTDILRNAGALVVSVVVILASIFGICAIKKTNRIVGIGSAVLYFVSMAFSLKMMKTSNAYLVLEFMCAAVGMLTAFCFKIKKK